MQTKNAEDANQKYMRNSMKAYLEGEQDLNWIRNIIHPDYTAARLMLGELSRHGREERYRELSEWFGSAGIGIGDTVREHGTHELRKITGTHGEFFQTQVGRDFATMKMISGVDLELVAKQQQSDTETRFVPGRSIMGS